MQFLVWQHLIFILPVLFAAMVVAGAAMGAVDLDVDVDVDADADAEGNAQSGSAGLMATLGIGRAPLAVVLVSLLGIFGGTGLALSQVLVGLTGWLTLSALVSAGISLVVAFFATAALSRLIGRLLPATETYANDAMDLIGATGVVEVTTSSAFGMAHVTARDGTFHQIRCRTEGASLRRGTRILVTDYDAEAGTHLVERSPI